MKYLTLFTSAFVAIAAPGTAIAQDRGTVAELEGNARQAADLRARLDAVESRIGQARRDRSITRARAAQLRRQVGEVRRSMAQSARRQGFVSAGEFASYERTLGAIEIALGDPEASRGYGNDALPSAEVLAFQRMDNRLRYRDARVDRDFEGCAVYAGVDRSRQARQERLLDPNGRPICVRR